MKADGSSGSRWTLVEVIGTLRRAYKRRVRKLPRTSMKIKTTSIEVTKLPWE